MEENNKEINIIRKFKTYKVFDVILGFCLLFIIIHYLFSAPVGTKDVILHINSSDSLSKISSDLKHANVIHYPYIFKNIVFILNSDKKVKSGDYLFKKNSTVWNVSMQIVKGIHGVNPIKFTFKEGITNEQIAIQLSDKLAIFRKDAFLNDPRAKQGYLFPDTYFFFTFTTVDEVLEAMTSNYNDKILKISDDIKSSGKSINNIVTMASIIEKEAKGKNDSYIISGILWKRIKLGMPLQVDASLVTYKESGLPEKPISNPGLISIDSAIHPVSSPYLFYLHDKNGIVHYADNFTNHKKNISKYLK